jgi:hypothetical protein
MPFLPVPQDSGDEVADAVKDPPDVDAHHEFPIVGRHVDQPGAVHRYSGVVAGDVQLAESALGFRQQTAGTIACARRLIRSTNSEADRQARPLVRNARR